MSQKNEVIWKSIQVISWIIFLAYCIEAGALLFNYIYSLFRPIATENLYMGLNLSTLYHKSTVIYSVLFSLIIFLSIIKAFLFFNVVKIFRKLNMVKPFSEDVSVLITKISYCAFAIGITGYLSYKFTKKLILNGYDAGMANEFWKDSLAYFIMAAVVFVIAMIFKKGIELQKEQDLTV